jgi:uncharacterized metal-binding protein YceD (DUF177 family)
MDKAGSGDLAASISPWSVPVSVDDIPDSGRHFEIEAPEATRAKVLDLVAGLGAVQDLKALSAVFDITRRGAKVHIGGHVSAKVAQTCVVTLEPIENAVEEEVDVLFAPPAGEAKPAFDENEPENDPLEAVDQPEPLVGGTVDLGALATEFLVIGVDPYPRKPGVEFGSLQVGDDGPRHFAALEALKKRFGGDQT